MPKETCVELVKTTAAENPGLEQGHSVQAPPSIRNNPNVLPMPAELFNPIDEKDAADLPPFYSAATNLVGPADQMQSELTYGFGDQMDVYEEQLPNPVRQQPMHMGGYGGGRMRGGGMPRHNQKPKMNNRGGRGMMPRIPSHGGPRAHMGGYQPY